MLHAYVVKFDVTENFEKFLVFFLNYKARLNLCEKGAQ